LITTILLSDVMKNAATAAILCPIAPGIAETFGVNPYNFLMAVAIGASCAFLTPIGYQNNTLILGPCGFRFGDYWRLGLLVEVIVVVVRLPLLLIVWPLKTYTILYAVDYWPMTANHSHTVVGITEICSCKGRISVKPEREPRESNPRCRKRGWGNR
jgi:hypothetical protein